MSFKFCTVATHVVRWGLHASDLFVQHIPKMLNRIEIWEIWRSNQHLKLIVVLLKPFPNYLCFVARQIMLLKEAAVIREYGFQERFI